jgi:PAS domain-containing protein
VHRDAAGAFDDAPTTTCRGRRITMDAVRALSPLERRQSRSGNPGSKRTTRVITMSPAASLNDDFLFSSLMETMADSIYFKDRQGRLLRVSPKMARDLGYADPAELVGKTDVDLFGQEFAQRTMLDDSTWRRTNRSSA